MTLPGKYCIGLIEEDNPQKSYFRFRPLLMAENEGYVPFDSPDVYPEDGCIRIVPDKNESGHFKTRMRGIGLFAVVNLIDHVSENDKIRANKNYHGDGMERNAYIIYSDVIREPNEALIYQLLDIRPEDAENAPLDQFTRTPRVLLCVDGEILPQVMVCSADENQSDCYRLNSNGTIVDVSKLYRFEITGADGTKLQFAALPSIIPAPAKVEKEPVRKKEAPAPKPVVEPEKPAEPEKPVEPEKPAEKAPVEEKPAEKAQSEEKPWISHTDVFDPKPIDPRLDAFKQALAAQSGFNPRRSRSLQEIIDEKWRHSRLDTLAQPVPAEAETAPVDSPMERAVSAVREVWSYPDQRIDLIRQLTAIECLEDAMELGREAARKSTVDAQITELEAQRLTMLGEIDDMRKKKKELRDALKQEILTSESALFDDAVRKTQIAQAECARHEEAAAKAKVAAECAEDALNAMSDGRFEQRLHEFAITSHSVELLRRMDEREVMPAETVGEKVDAEALIARVLDTFAAAGRPIRRNDAIHLLICAAQKSLLLLSGASGSGKSATVRLLAEALGASFAEYAPDVAPLTDDDALKALRGSAVAMVSLDDMNLAPCDDPARGLMPAADHGNFLLCATVQDGGSPVPAFIFDRAFTVRLDEEPADSSWEPAPVSERAALSPVSFESLRAAFPVAADAVPESVKARLKKLRADLAALNIRLSRRTLDALWSYCAAAIPAMKLEASAIFDRAFAQRALPAILAGAPLDALSALPRLVADLPECKKLLAQPLPIRF